MSEANNKVLPEGQVLTSVLAGYLSVNAHLMGYGKNFCYFCYQVGTLGIAQAFILLAITVVTEITGFADIPHARCFLLHNRSLLTFLML